MIDFGLLERFRKQKGKTQSDLADLLEMTQGSYSNKAKLGRFDEVEVAKICKFLGIKKEQIQVMETHVNELTFLTSKAIQTESALKVLLGAMAELLAHQSGGNVTKIRADLESTVDSLSKQALERLQRPKQQ